MAGTYRTRIALVLGDSIVAERMVADGERVTIGDAADASFVLPTTAAGLADRLVLLEGRRLHLLPVLEGRLHLSTGAVDVESLREGGAAAVDLEPEDWAVLRLSTAPGVRLLVQRIPAEPRPRLPPDRSGAPLWTSTAVSAAIFAAFMVVAFLDYEPDRPMLDTPAVSDRMARALFNRPPPEEEEPPAEVSDEDREEEKARKRAGGDEGKFGRPDKRGPSNVPRSADEVAANTGLVRELNQLAQTNTMGDLLGVSGQVGQALSGLDEGELVVGAGNFGMSTKGGGQGGGGEGEGVIHGTGDVDVGGAGSTNRKRSVKGTKRPKEKKVSVRPGRAKVRGQLSKALIDREVRRHRAQIAFCYNKQLLRFPNLSGKVVLSWIISMDGSVRNARVKSSSLGNRDAESCMVRALESWKFPKPEGGVVQVDYPFVFGTK
ncbi:MAG: energy transducer TonB [Deltaproteobacteria bacterium]|nr:MAG: energy transducer TonB [Deltaproteobacteria bacterium]